MNVLVEGGGVVEHASHAGDLGCVPRTDVLIEDYGAVEHVGHVGDV